MATRQHAHGIVFAALLLLAAIGAYVHGSANLEAKVNKAKLRKLSKHDGEDSDSLTDKDGGRHHVIQKLPKASSTKASGKAEDQPEKSKKSHDGESDDSKHIVKIEDKQKHSTAESEVKKKSSTVESEDKDKNSKDKEKHDTTTTQNASEPFDLAAYRNECIDDKRVKLNWTDSTCVTRGMLIDEQGMSSLYLSCGAEATIYKFEKFKTIIQMEKRTCKLIALAMASGLLPMIASSLVFQACSGPKKDGYNEVTDQTTKTACDKFIECVGFCGFLVFVMGIICMAGYTTYMTSMKVYAELHEFNDDLHFGAACNLYMYMNYVQHEEIFCVLTLACYSWSDFLFHIFRMCADTCICCKGLLWTLWIPIEYCCCCKWVCPLWNGIVYKCKVFFCCFGFQKWVDVFVCCWCALCKQILTVFCVLIAVVVCYFPIIGAFIVMIAYTFACIAVVMLFYLGLALIATFFLLIAVYVLLLPVQGLAKCAGKKQKVDTLPEYFAGAYDTLGHELKPAMASGLGAALTEEELNKPPEPCLSKIKGFVTSKTFAVLLPLVMPMSFFFMQYIADLFMETWTLFHASLEDRQKLQLAINGSWQETLQYLWTQYCAAFGNANDFVKEMLIDKIIHAAVFIQSLKKYLDPEEFMVAVATLADLGAKFEDFQNAVMAMRFGSGLLVGPLKLFEMLAKFDQVPN